MSLLCILFAFASNESCRIYPIDCAAASNASAAFVSARRIIIQYDKLEHIACTRCHVRRSPAHRSDSYETWGIRDSAEPCVFRIFAKYIPLDKEPMLGALVVELFTLCVGTCGCAGWAHSLWMKSTRNVWDGRALDNSPTRYEGKKDTVARFAFESLIFAC